MTKKDRANIEKRVVVFIYFQVDNYSSSSGVHICRKKRNLANVGTAWRMMLRTTQVGANFQLVYIWINFLYRAISSKTIDLCPQVHCIAKSSSAITLSFGGVPTHRACTTLHFWATTHLDYVALQKRQKR